jgi:hypothetical protein
MSRFTRLAVTHALMMAGDAAMVVALADSFFFSVELDAARTQVLLFLAISFAPFLFIAPLIGPLIDRIAGGRRLVVQIVALTRVVLLLLMARYIDGLALFPLVFASLVLQKTYVVSKSALVPSTVRSETELVEANSKLGLLSGLTGAVAVVPAGILLKTIGPGGALVYGALLFGGAFFSATRLPKEVIAEDRVDPAEREQLHSSALQSGAVAMTVLRANVGFTFFHLAFWLRSQDQGTLWFGAAVGASAVAAMLGNAIASRVRQRMAEETMLTTALIVSAVAGVGLAVVGGPVAGVAIAGVVNFVASIGRLSFESIVQRDAPGANQGRAFAQFETRFQFAWAAAAFVAVAIRVPGPIGFLIVGIVAAGTMVNLRFGAGMTATRSGRRRSASKRRRPASGRSGTRTSATKRRGKPGPARGRAPRSRSASERPPDR